MTPEVFNELSSKFLWHYIMLIRHASWSTKCYIQLLPQQWPPAAVANFNWPHVFAGKSSESVQWTCWGPVTHALTCAQLIQYSAVYRFGSLSYLHVGWCDASTSISQWCGCPSYVDCCHLLANALTMVAHRHGQRGHLSSSGNVVNCFCALVVTAKCSVDELFMH